MDKRFIAHKDYLANEANLSCIIEKYVLKDAIPRRVDKIEWIENFPDDFSQYLDKNCIPIGDLNWVRDWLSHTPYSADPNMTPLEIPDALLPFVNREYFWARGSEMDSKYMDGNKYFLKDIDTLKKWNSWIYEGDLSEFIEPNTFYSVSEKVNFLSEWRVFVYEDFPKGVCNYLGDPIMFPNRETIYSMIAAMREDILKPHPRAYTLDVGVVIDKESNNQITVPIEVHPFVACGLYGFSDPVIVDMLVAGYEWYRDEADNDILDNSED